MSNNACLFCIALLVCVHGGGRYGWKEKIIETNRKEDTQWALGKPQVKPQGPFRIPDLRQGLVWTLWKLYFRQKATTTEEDLILTYLFSVVQFAVLGTGISHVQYYRFIPRNKVAVGGHSGVRNTSPCINQTIQMVTFDLSLHLKKHKTTQIMVKALRISIVS